CPRHRDLAGAEATPTRSPLSPWSAPSRPCAASSSPRSLRTTCPRSSSARSCTSSSVPASVRPTWPARYWPLLSRWGSSCVRWRTGGWSSARPRPGAACRSRCTPRLQALRSWMTSPRACSPRSPPRPSAWNRRPTTGSTPTCIPCWPRSRP
ncbi:MAG: hypothetical protein AVDCRST_MAG66-2662, partial [uncultured Pseudonocardia sp.]